MNTRKSRWGRSCALTICFCLVAVFLATLVIQERSTDIPLLRPDAATTMIDSTDSPGQENVPTIIPLPSMAASVVATLGSVTPAFIGGAGVVLTSEAIVQSTKVEAYRDRVRATWTAAAQTMEPLRAQMTLTATLWQK